MVARKVVEDSFFINQNEAFDRKELLRKKKTVPCKPLYPKFVMNKKSRASSSKTGMWLGYVRISEKKKGRFIIAQNER